METRTLQRIAAYGVARADDAVLLVRSSLLSDFPGVWTLPGGGVDFGEDPLDAVVRELREETGLLVRPDGDVVVLSDVAELPAHGTRTHPVLLHSVRVCVRVAVLGGELVDELDGTTDAVRWVPLAEAEALPLMPFVAEALARLGPARDAQRPPDPGPGGRRAPGTTSPDS